MNNALGMPVFLNDQMIQFPFDPVQMPRPFDAPAAYGGSSSPPEDFGIVSTGVNVVALYGGTVPFGNPPISIIQSDVAVTDELAYVFWQLDATAKTLVFGSQSAFPTNSVDPTTGNLILRCALWQVARDVTTHQVSVVKKCSRLLFPGNTAD